MKLNFKKPHQKEVIWQQVQEFEGENLLEEKEETDLLKGEEFMELEKK